MKKEPTPHSDSELDELVKMIPVWHTIQMQKAMEDGNPKHNKDYQDQAKTALLQWADRRAEKLVVEARINNLQIVANVYAQAMDLSGDNQSAYKEMYLARRDTLAEMTKLAALTATKEEE